MTDSYNYGNINLATDPGDNFLQSIPGAAFGSTNTAVLISGTTPVVVGDAFTYVSSVTEGDSIIINKTGLYQINATISNGAAAPLTASISRGATGSLNLDPPGFGGAQGNIALGADPTSSIGFTIQLSATIYVSQADLAQPTPTPINPARIIRVLATPGAAITANSRLFIRAI